MFASMNKIEQKPMVKKGHFEINWTLAMKAPAAQKKKEAHSVLRLDATAKKRFDRKLFKFKKFSIK